MIVLKRAGKELDPLFSAAETGRFPNVTERVFLGLLNGSARFGLAIASDAADALKTHDNFHVTDLRSIAVQGLIDAGHLAPVAEAKAPPVGAETGPSFGLFSRAIMRLHDAIEGRTAASAPDAAEPAAPSPGAAPRNQDTTDDDDLLMQRLHSVRSS